MSPKKRFPQRPGKKTRTTDRKIIVRRRNETGSDYDEDADSDSEQSEPKTGATSEAKRQSILNAFGEVWGSLFASPIHLDSALSKQPPHRKGVLAQLLPRILLRPASQAEAVGVGVGPGEPWELDRLALGRWRASALTAEKLYESMSSGVEEVEPVAGDFPPTMIDEWEREWGKEGARHLVSTLGREAPLSLRVTRELAPADLLKQFRAQGDLPVTAGPSDFCPTGLRLGGYVPLFGTKAYQSGHFEIQDEGSQLMAWFALWPELFASLLSEAPGQVKLPDAMPTLPTKVQAWTVVDACAGAGGKTLALGDALGGKGRIYSYDISETKLLALRRRAKRAGLNNFQAVKVEEGAEDKVVARFRRRADVVLVDAPCSGWGVLRRNPDIKWRQDRAVLERMPEIQSRLLKAYSELVAPGGTLVFGVCTFRKAETRQVVEKFLAASKDFEKGPGGYLGPGPCDGFFMQSFRRRKGE
jgi:16S rRNA C967 or C1407 C5-methylase (RsmB/RsmF family)